MNLTKKIKGNDTFNHVSSIIIKARYRHLRKKILLYLKCQDMENLHKMRISVRRFRYSLENFEICLSSKNYLAIITILGSLQDLIGEGRDIDVFREKIAILINENNCEISGTLVEILDQNKIAVTLKINAALESFMENSEIRKIIGKMP